ncbi:DUF3857 domain-containing protein [Olleya sp. HaHaR_3_96]|uniref:DUF3857 domain-containing protein n=1 Tax=Olleya sp. HaHaR_3_96 TaxID=2745560 RepID=UPI001C4F540A|nr:DUF3857 domain-containing protein [Olleya sp. HaHaR_3_96]QXP59200.1 DUF3857 domain-containing protein [Olleya sp. HaHaR_3_96]
MKKLLIITLAFILSTQLYSQTKIEEKAEAFFWGANDTHKSSFDIPEKWVNESAVILYKNENYDFHKFGKNVTYTTSIRKRVKLLDAAAVEEFSEFSFVNRFRSNKGRYTWKSKGDNVIGVKIVKSDGKEIIIDVSKDAIEVDGENKLAISNLEVGDIIDYYFYKVEPFKSTYPVGFDPVENTLSEEYPILEFKLFFETENDFFLNFNTYNGAPKLQELTSEKNNQRRYKLEVNDIEKRELPIWFYSLLELPSYKFQVFFARRSTYEKKALAFLPSKEDIVKESVSQEEVLELYENRFKPQGDIGDLKDFFKKKDYTDDSKKVTDAYYYMRHYYLTRFIEAFFVNEASILNNPFAYYGNSPVFIQNEKQFIRHFTSFLKRQKIDYDIVIAKKKYDGTIEDLLIEQNVSVLLKIKTPSPLYLSFFGPHTSINQYSPYLEGTDVYLLSNSKGRIEGITKSKLPSSTYKDNVIQKEISLSLNQDFSNINVATINKFKGHFKEDEQYSTLLLHDYVNEDYKKYGTESLLELIRNKKVKIKFEKEFSALIEKLEERQKENLKKSIESEFNIPDAKDYNFNIKSTGRYGLDSLFSFEETYSIENSLIKKAGPNYIFEIGKFIGGQVDLDKDQKVRTENVHMTFPRSISYQIKLEIPEGYNVNGLDKLNKSVDNSAGSFISTAKLEGNLLIIDTLKVYKSSFLPNKDWPLLVQFLEEALQFTHEKILLKKA